MPPAPLVSIRSLSVSYGGRALALDDVSLDIFPGRVVAVVGPNGAGKTTLLRSFFGDTPRIAGTVRLGDRDPFAIEQRRGLWAVARWVGFTSTLYEELSIREFLEFSARAYGVPEERVRFLTEDIAENLGLTGDLELRIKRASDGTKRKAHVASGFFSGVSGPRVIVLDEPTNGLDLAARQILARHLQRYVHPDGHPGDRAVLISSHNLAELSAMADYVVILSQGRIVRTGTIHELDAERTTDLRYVLTLFDEGAAALVEALRAPPFELDCEVRDTRAVSFTAPDPETVERVVQLVADPGTPFRLRELREALSPLERIYIQEGGG
jgi:ABC-type multidrug transport system ATPase subunit